MQVLLTIDGLQGILLQRNITKNVFLRVGARCIVPCDKKLSVQMLSEIVKKEKKRLNRMFCHSHPPKMCNTGNRVVQSSWQKVSHQLRRLSGDTRPTTQVPCVREQGQSHKVNISEVLINIVSIEQPKVLIGCNQKVQGWIVFWHVTQHRQKNPRWRGTT